MKVLLLTLTLAFATQAYAAFDPVYEGECGMQLGFKDKPPRIWNVAKVKLKAGETYEIYRDGAQVYSVVFLAYDQTKPLYGLMISLVDKSKGRKVTQASAFHHDLEALKDTNVGLYMPKPKPTAFCHEPRQL